MWRVVVGGGVMVDSCEDTPSPTTTLHIVELWHQNCSKQLLLEKKSNTTTYLSQQ